METPNRMIDRFIESWRQLGLYERFEQVVAIFLSVLIGIVIVMACWRLGVTIFSLLILKVDVIEFAVFQTVFGSILTVLIALEFNHSIVQVVERKQSLIQVRIVVLIAILALVRKFILLDVAKTDPMTLFGLAAVVVALSALYWVVREGEGIPRRTGREGPSNTGSGGS